MKNTTFLLFFIFLLFSNSKTNKTSKNQKINPNDLIQILQTQEDNNLHYMKNINTNEAREDIKTLEAIDIKSDNYIYAQYYIVLYNLLLDPNESIALAEEFIEKHSSFPRSLNLYIYILNIYSKHIQNIKSDNSGHTLSAFRLVNKYLNTQDIKQHKHYRKIVQFKKHFISIFNQRKIYNIDSHFKSLDYILALKLSFEIIEDSDAPMKYKEQAADYIQKTLEIFNLKITTNKIIIKKSQN